jgi:hypothetical protein
MKKLLWVPAALLGLGGCGAPFAFLRGADRLDATRVCEAKGAHVDAADRVGARMELQNAHYDGKALSGRLLIGPTAESLCLDKRLIEEFTLVMEAVAECGTGRDVGFFVTDVMAPPMKEEDVLVLEPGSWYGKDVSIFLFSEKLTGQPSPDCIEAEFTFHALNVQRAARLRVRVARTNQPSSGGTDGEEGLQQGK